MPCGPESAVGSATSATAPAVEMLLIFAESGSVNQRLPSGPATMPKPGPKVGTSVTPPAVVILPIFFAMRSVNHSAPSGPTAMPYGSLSAVGTANSVIAPLTVIRPILLPEAADSVNHRAPSGPAVMNSGPAPAARGYSVKIPAGEILPILLPASSVNQIAPSGPAARPWGWPPGAGMEASAMAPAGAT